MENSNEQIPVALQPERIPCRNCDRLLGTYAGGTILVRWHQLEVYGVPPIRVRCRHCGYLNMIPEIQRPEARTA